MAYDGILILTHSIIVKMVKIGDFERVRFSICGCSHRDYGRMIPNLENFARLDRDRVPPGYAGGCFCARHEREFSALHSFYLLLFYYIVIVEFLISGVSFVREFLGVLHFQKKE